MIEKTSRRFIASSILGGLPVLLDAEVVDEGRAAAHGDHVDDGRHQVRVPEQHQARAAANSR